MVIVSPTFTVWAVAAVIFGAPVALLPLSLAWRRRSRRRGDFPAVRDVPLLAPQEATDALAALRTQVAAGHLRVYYGTGGPWFVWRDRDNQRIEVADWCASWLVARDAVALPEGGAA